MITAKAVLAVVQSDNREQEELIKAYGRQCAEQALKDASEGVYSDRTLGMTIKQGILSTPILTP